MKLPLAEAMDQPNLADFIDREEVQPDHFRFVAEDEISPRVKEAGLAWVGRENLSGNTDLTGYLCFLYPDEAPQIRKRMAKSYFGNTIVSDIKDRGSTGITDLPGRILAEKLAKTNLFTIERELFRKAASGYIQTSAVWGRSDRDRLFLDTFDLVAKYKLVFPSDPSFDPLIAEGRIDFLEWIKEQLPAKDLLVLKNLRDSFCYWAYYKILYPHHFASDLADDPFMTHLRQRFAEREQVFDSAPHIELDDLQTLFRDAFYLTLLTHDTIHVTDDKIWVTDETPLVTPTQKKLPEVVKFTHQQPPFRD